MSERSCGETDIVGYFLTDIVGYSLPFIRDDVDLVRFQGMPGLNLNVLCQLKALFGLISSMEHHKVTIRDARKRTLPYEVHGFTLLELDSAVSDWDSDEQLDRYKLEVEEMKI